MYLDWECNHPHDNGRNGQFHREASQEGLRTKEEEGRKVNGGRYRTSPRRERSYRQGQGESSEEIIVKEQDDEEEGLVLFIILLF